MGMFMTFMHRGQAASHWRLLGHLSRLSISDQILRNVDWGVDDKVTSGSENAQTFQGAIQPSKQGVRMCIWIARDFSKFGKCNEVYPCSYAEPTWAQSVRDVSCIYINPIT